MAFTYFFRDLQTLELLVELLLPVASGRNKITVWDAGCASGQEPYTLAILMAEKMHSYTFRNVVIHATDLDISNHFGDTIKNGIYQYGDLERIPKELFAKYFAAINDDDHYQIDSLLRSKIVFKRENLLNLSPPAEEVALVLCKNVLLHLLPDEQISVIRSFHKAMFKGALFAMENTQKLPNEVAHLFEKVVSNAQIYRKK